MDAYDLQARHAPFVFSLLPAILVAIVMIPGLGHTKIVTSSMAFLVLTTMSLVGTRIARAAGRARQDALYAAWGGMPTTTMLRYRDTRLNPHTKRIFRERLGRLGTSFPIPTGDEEQRDPEGADIKIGAAMDEIRKRAKAKGIKAVHRENINYGAARNAYGLKPLGLATCLISATVLVITIALRSGFSPTPLELVVGMVILITASVKIFGCTSDNVRHHGEAYALALFEAIEAVAPVSRRKKV
jgi:hypothetical protein